MQGERVVDAVAEERDPAAAAALDANDTGLVLGLTRANTVVEVIAVASASRAEPGARRQRFRTVSGATGTDRV